MSLPLQIPCSSTHCLPSHTAEGMPSNLSISSCHCQSSGFGAMIRTGFSPHSAINIAAIANWIVFPRPTISAST